MILLRRLAFVWGVAAGVGACGVDERGDFLIGRQCNPRLADECDPGQACLAHAWRGGARFSDHRCRDEASFFVPNAPLAYCNADEPCPGRLQCNADRVRLDATVRPLVCKPPDDLFSPPLDGGT